jgi:uncharacterized phage infection (PIP) family protein YhgE
MRHVWREYREHLAPSGAGSIPVVTTTKLPSEHFTLEALAAGRVPLRFFSSFSNMLVGFGIFGTFLGLAAGIHLVSQELSGSAEELKGALGGLLGGAFLSFLKSAVAILCSIVFTLTERHGIAALESAIDNVCKALDRRLRLQTPEQIAQEQLRELAAVRQLNGEFVPQLAAALEQRITVRLEAALVQVHQGLLDLKAERASSNEEFLTKSLDEFRKSVQGAAGDELQNLARSLGAVRETVDRSASALAVGQEQFESANLRVAAAIEHTLDSATNGMKQHFETLHQTVTATVSESTRALVEQLEAGGRALTSQVSEQSRHLAEGAEHLHRTLAAYQELLAGVSTATDRMSGVADTLATVHGQFNNSMEALRGIETAVRAASEKLEGTVENQGHLAGLLSDASRTIAATMQQTAASWGEYQTRFEGLDQTLGSVFRELDAGLTRYSEAMRAYVQDVETHMAKAAENLAGTIGQLSDDLSELPAEVKELGGYVKALKSTVRIEE